MNPGLLREAVPCPLEMVSLAQTTLLASVKAAVDPQLTRTGPVLVFCPDTDGVSRASRMLLLRRRRRRREGLRLWWEPGARPERRVQCTCVMVHGTVTGSDT